MLQAVYCFQLQFYQLRLQARYVCKRYFDSLFITFTGSDLSVTDCISIEHRLLFHNCDFVRSTSDTYYNLYAVFKAKSTISFANAKHLLSTFTNTKASFNSLIYIWPPGGAVENGYCRSKKLRCIGKKALLNYFQIDVKFYSFFMLSLFQGLSVLRVISDSLQSCIYSHSFCFLHYGF